eukprot:TRINITY_DN4547_c0_g1_i1.p1 TRINITY_DN4547_c0_g1~~TRINITY_DN4547_c0_g1_i1.p1  ORF type:complete len:243 (+),score=28.32 TRINITY_DN4547_c0_g1_i1:59-730(+)
MGETDLARISAVCEWLETVAGSHRPARTQVNYTRTLKSHANEVMDPDAGLRGLAYDPLDQTEEDIMLQSVWALLREGKQKQAGEYCENYGQSWRAVSISGGGIPHNDATGNRDGVAGNSPEMWLMWRRSCRRIAHSSSSDIEKAIYGFLGGLVEFVFPVCRDWQDFVWACGRIWQSWKMEELVKTHVKTHNKKFFDKLGLHGDNAKLDKRFDSISKILSNTNQ